MLGLHRRSGLESFQFPCKCLNRAGRQSYSCRQTVRNGSGRNCKVSGADDSPRSPNQQFHGVGRPQMSSNGSSRGQDAVSSRYDGARPWRHLKTITADLNSIRCRIGSQWRSHNTGVMRSNFLVRSQHVPPNSGSPEASSADSHMWQTRPVSTLHHALKGQTLAPFNLGWRLPG